MGAAMAEEKKENKTPKAPRQSWEPHWSLNTLKSIWSVAFGVFKVVLGAVATVAVNGAANAALLAVQILSVADPALAAALDEKKQKDAAAVLAKDAALQAQLNA